MPKSPKSSAGITVSDEIRAEQKESLKHMTFKQKLAYFWEYYKVHLFVVLGCIAVVTSIIHSILTSKDTIFYALMINSYGLDSTLSDDFAAYAGIDTEQYLCYIDTNSMLDLGSSSQYDMAMIQRIIAITLSGDLDVMVSDAEVFTYYGQEPGFFADLRTLYTDEELAPYQNNLYYIDTAVTDAPQPSAEVDPYTISEPTEQEREAAIDSHRHPETMQNPVPIGIFMEDSAFISATGSYPVSTPIFGILASTKRPENAKSYLNYLWTTDGPSIAE